MPTTAAEVRPVPAAPSTWQAADNAPILTIGYQRLGLADIEKLPLYATTLQTNWGMTGEFHGVRLTDLLEAYGLGQVERIKLKATDQYVVTLKRADIVAGQPLLATRFEGQPLTMQNKGPLILLWPDRAEKVLNGTAPVATWIWSVIQISERR